MSNQHTNKQTHIEPDPIVQEQRAFWLEMGKDMLRKSFEPIDETAKQIVGISTILIGLYFNAIAFSKLQGKVNDWATIIFYLLPVIFLLLSLIASLHVFFPNLYRHNINSSEASRFVFEHALKRKWISLQIASIFLPLSIVFLIVTICIYLHG